MRVEELFTNIRHTLQDQSKAYWTDTELLDYYNECKSDMARERQEEVSIATLILDPLKSVYNTDGILRFIEIKDDLGNTRPMYDLMEKNDDKLGVEIISYNKLGVNDTSIGSELYIMAVVQPKFDNLDNSVRAGDETALKSYVLSKAYEKDSDMQNFQKAQYFYTKYNEIFKDLMGAKSVGYKSRDDKTTTAYYY